MVYIVWDKFFVVLPSFLIIIIKESPKEAGIQMIQYKRQEVFIEFETCWELVRYLKDELKLCESCNKENFINP